MDRVIPNSLEAEQRTLGAVLLEPVDGLGWCLEHYPGPEAFYDLKHRQIYNAILKLHDRGEPIEVLSVCEQLKSTEEYEQSGGYGYVSALADDAVGQTAEYYGKIVAEKFQLRSMLTALQLSMQMIYDLQDGDVRKCLDSIESKVLDAGQKVGGGEAEKISQPVARVMQTLDEYKRGVGMITGVRTGYSYLDKMIGGLHAGEMCVLAGRPSTGKTSMAANIMDWVAVEENLPVAMFSLEMSKEDISLRMLCARAGAAFHKIRTGFMSEDDHQGLIEMSKKVGCSPIYLDDTPSMDITQMRSRARRLVQRYGVKLVVIDYLQLAQAEGDQEVQMISNISKGCKMMARQMNIPVLVLSQLNRESERDKKRKPQLSDLRGSGSIEQDADLCMLLYRRPPEDEQEEEEQEVTQTYSINVFVAKQRNGPTGDAEFKFDRQLMRFEDAYGGKGHR